MEFGTDIASAVLRGAIGSTMLAHGVRHGRTLDGTGRWFASIGFQRPRTQAALSAVVEAGSGLALIVGAATPLASAAVIGTMAVAYRTVHRPHGYFITDEGWEYVGLISAATVALSALGAGRLSVDRILGLDGIGSAVDRAVACAAIGAVGAAVQLKMFWRPVDLQQMGIEEEAEASNLEPDRIRKDVPQ